MINDIVPTPPKPKVDRPAPPVGPDEPEDVDGTSSSN